MSKVKNIIKEMNIIAPPYLKEDFDNVGLMVGDKEQEVKKVLLALDCTKEVIEEAKEVSAELIITHHPLIFRKPSRIVRDDLQGYKIIELIKNDISLFSSHTNLDSTIGGINEKIVELLELPKGKVIEPSKCKGYEEAGLGRLITLEEEISLDSLLEKVKEKLQIKNLRVVIGERKINKIAIINGSGQDFFNKAIAMGADCIITGDTTYHFASDYKEMGITIIDAGHFSTEWLVFLEVMKKLENKFQDVEFITSKKVKDPYTFF